LADLMDEKISNPGKIRALVARVWQQKKDLTLVSIGVVEEASSALLSGVLTPELRERAAMEAHKLAGSLGTFGFPEGSHLSRAIEEILTGRTELERVDAEHLAVLLQQLRRILENA
jgi:HPt (histidine-containing phosphotransfer) domain-containing protein